MGKIPSQTLVKRHQVVRAHTAETLLEPAPHRNHGILYDS